MKSKILRILENNKSIPISGGELAKQLGVSRNAVWKHINSLKDEGYDIISLKNSGYIFSENNDKLSEFEISKHLISQEIGRKMLILKSTNSTNTEMKKLVNEQNMPHGFTLLSEEQTQGRGRRGRSFISNSEQGLYMSICLKIDEGFNDFVMITIAAAVAVCSAVKKIIPNQSPAIKWVNDIFLGDKKLCGILTEVIFNVENNSAESIIVGIGINTGKLPEEVENIATTLAYFTKNLAIRNQLAAYILNELEVQFNILQKSPKLLIDNYRQLLFMLGKEVVVDNFKEKFTVLALNIDEKGRLIAEKVDSSREKLVLSSAEISIIKG